MKGTRRDAEKVQEREKERDESVFTFGNGLTEGYFFRTSRSFSWYILKSKAKFKK